MVSGSLVLDSGLVHTTAAAVLTLADQSTVTAGNAASDVDGPLRKQEQQVFVFPLGQNGQWARLGISAPTDPEPRRSRPSMWRQLTLRWWRRPRSAK